MRDLGPLLLTRALLDRGAPAASALTFREIAGPRGPLAGISATCFLVYDGADSARAFVLVAAPRLLAHLSRSTLPRRETLQGRVRGRVDWGLTVRARCDADQDRTTFVCRRNGYLFDVAENRLLKHVLLRLQAAVARTPPWVHTCRLRREFGDALRVGDLWTELAGSLRRQLANAALREVTAAPAIDQAHIAAAERSRNPLYVDLARLAWRLDAVVERPRWHAWRDAVEPGIGLLPLREARLFDLLSNPAHG